MKLFLTILMVCIAYAAENVYYDCSNGEARVQITQLDVTPEILILGKPLTLVAHGTITGGDVNGGNAALYTQFDNNGVWVQLPPLGFDNCEWANCGEGGSGCPCPEGPGRSQTISMTIPDAISEGNYQGVFESYDENGILLFRICWIAHVHGFGDEVNNTKQAAYKSKHIVEKSVNKYMKKISKPEESFCTSELNVNALETHKCTFNTIMKKTCGFQCYLGESNCAECLAKNVGIDGGCSSCFRKVVKCSSDNCSSCLFNPSSPECLACTEEKCETQGDWTLLGCTGLTEAQMPVDQCCSEAGCSPCPCA
eukprot:TRINITY_DN12096_c0_g1_i1.p1 TRINITY_DN12096_c0_g1~~TRINITY_DN12096_c0_g1_i1.p1  ORF type:complete len:310 (+),score=53.99 TRINITY_DN12096_c0_g1_i1:58-987(+)